MSIRWAPDLAWGLGPRELRLPLERIKIGIIDPAGYRIPRGLSARASDMLNPLGRPRQWGWEQLVVLLHLYGGDAIYGRPALKSRKGSMRDRRSGFLRKN